MSGKNEKENDVKIAHGAHQNSFLPQIKEKGDQSLYILNPRFIIIQNDSFAPLHSSKCNLHYISLSEDIIIIS